jgi:hypothetical protein
MAEAEITVSILLLDVGSRLIMNFNPTSTYYLYAFELLLTRSR